ncbi:MAG TPA: 7,8-didemethyl-8-hydroxy-5-deazariboflavin synthase CofG [candidate division Zixibacteria bacterium]|nr:7,8-didemethyl-8-hydroxy-5-deazariboflavin synthase CofG [candidate division Zixibacteria bacterium]
MERVLQDCADGRPLTREAALRLAESAEIEPLLAAAAALRDRGKGKVVSFSPKVFLPLTNLCRDFCGYCTFRRAPGEPGARTMTIEEVLRTARRGETLGCTEALFSLGDKPEAIYPEMRSFLAQRGMRRTLDYLYEACSAVLAETRLLPHCNSGLMGGRDLTRFREVNASVGLMLESVSERLASPGGPHAAAPDKKPATRLRMIETAGRLRIPFTTGILIGIGETWPERVDSLFAIRALHERYGHIQEVIIQNFRQKPDIPMRAHREPTHAEMMKTIALARLILGSTMNIQAPPNLAPDGYGDYLRAGINDWGGVSPLTPDFINPEAPWPALQVLREKSAEAGFELKARLPVYPEFINDRFLAPGPLALARRLCGPDGYVIGGGPLRALASAGL